MILKHRLHYISSLVVGYAALFAWSLAGLGAAGVWLIYRGTFLSLIQILYAIVFILVWALLVPLLMVFSLWAYRAVRGVYFSFWRGLLGNHRTDSEA